MAAVTTKIFYETIKLLHPIVNTMVTEMCEMAKSEMKALDPSMVDCWQRVITTSDGVWLTRAKYSQNCTFTIRNNGGSRMGHLGQMPPPPSFKKLHTRSRYSNRAVNYSNNCNKAVTMLMRQCSLPMKLYRILFYITDVIYLVKDN